MSGTSRSTRAWSGHWPTSASSSPATGRGEASAVGGEEGLSPPTQSNGRGDWPVAFTGRRTAPNRRDHCGEQERADQEGQHPAEEESPDEGPPQTQGSGDGRPGPGGQG